MTNMYKEFLPSADSANFELDLRLSDDAIYDDADPVAFRIKDAGGNATWMGIEAGDSIVVNMAGKVSFILSPINTKAISLDNNFTILATSSSQYFSRENDSIVVTVEIWIFC